MEAEAGEFELWLRKVGSSAKDGNQEGRTTLWTAFNRLGWTLAQLARTEHSVHSDLFQGVLQYCLLILRYGLLARDKDALTYTHSLALRAIDLINETADREPDFVTKFKAMASDWPTFETRKLKTSRAQALSVGLTLIYGAAKWYGTA
jgi:hypothetical protein